MKYRISDSVTYTRSWIVDARDEDDALTQAIKNGPPDDDTFEEEQTDNTPYEAEPIEPEKKRRRA